METYLVVIYSGGPVNRDCRRIPPIDSKSDKLAALANCRWQELTQQLNCLLLSYTAHLGKHLGIYICIRITGRTFRHQSVLKTY